MDKKWLEHTDQYKGRGHISSSGGKLADVNYVLDVFQNMRERTGINMPREVVGGTYDMKGDITPETPLFVDVLTTITLTIEDGREMEIIMDSPNHPKATRKFKVSKDRNFFGKK